MKKEKIIAGISSLILSGHVWAFDCYYTLVKNDCWTSYNVSVEVTDVETEAVVLNAAIPAGTSWQRLPFKCKPLQTLSYKATFSPVVWESDKGKIYPAKRFWTLPETIKPGSTAWDVSVCFASDFADVPLPPKSSGNCKCDFTSLPEIPPK